MEETCKECWKNYVKMKNAATDLVKIYHLNNLDEKTQRDLNKIINDLRRK